MPRYFFDIRDNGLLVPDEEGLELPDLETARKEAATSLGDIGRDVFNGEERRELVIEVRDEAGPIFENRLVFEARSHARKGNGVADHRRAIGPEDEDRRVGPGEKGANDD